MKLFARNFLYFCFAFLAICLIGIFTPPSPKSSQSILFAQIDKDSLLVNTTSPRLILIGGSNIAFGVNSQMIKDSLKINPINTAIHAKIGLKFMLNHTAKFIKRGDIIIVVPEYQQYVDNTLYGSNELLRIAFEVTKDGYRTLSFKQWFHLSPEIVPYACSKYNIKNYFSSIQPSYTRKAVNKYGDAYLHWYLKQRPFEAASGVSDNFNQDAITELNNFRNEVQKKGATVYISFPAYANDYFDAGKKQIAHIQSELIKNNFKILGTPERYKIDRSLCFDTPYHLLKPGVDIRTRLLIADIKAYLF
jgi:hypothetical protein